MGKDAGFILSTSPIHLNISKYDKTCFCFSLRQFSLLLLLLDSPNHSLSTYSVHFQLSLEFQRSMLVAFFWDIPNIALGGGTYRFFLYSTRTRNSGLLSQPFTHPSRMPCRKWGLHILYLQFRQLVQTSKRRCFSVFMPKSDVSAARRMFNHSS